MLPHELPGTGLETFDPYQDPTMAAAAALYGGAPHCPFDGQGNYLCICAEI
ncbi:MAG TPA: hypothetical protein VFE05_04555 [Longimicrobiaceae bacterium]|jgi:hypothetical protein|nr:hypothetical protein [Longimicrobiaceae bacterium]